jgi:hypothetical protein
MTFTVRLLGDDRNPIVARRREQLATDVAYAVHHREDGQRTIVRYLGRGARGSFRFKVRRKNRRRR